MDSIELSLDTTGRRFTDLTPDANRFCAVAFATHSFGFASLRSGELATLARVGGGVGSASEQPACERSGFSAE